MMGGVILHVGTLVLYVRKLIIQSYALTIMNKVQFFGLMVEKLR